MWGCSGATRRPPVGAERCSCLRRLGRAVRSPECYACTTPCASTPRTTFMRRREPRSFGVLGRRHADRGRAAPWEYLSRRVYGGSFLACKRANLEAESSAEAPRGPDVVCRSCPREGPIKSSISAIRSSPVHVHCLLGCISLVCVSSSHGGSWVAKTPSTN